MMGAICDEKKVMIELKESLHQEIESDILSKQKSPELDKVPDHPEEGR